MLQIPLRTACLQSLSGDDAVDLATVKMHVCLSADPRTQTYSLQVVLCAACLQSLGRDDAVDLAHFAHEVEGAPSKAIHDRVRVATGAAGQPILAALDCPGATGAFTPACKASDADAQSARQSGTQLGPSKGGRASKQSCISCQP